MRHFSRWMALGLGLVVAGAGYVAADAGADGNRTFDVTAARFSFTPGVLEVAQGDHVTLHLHSRDVEHGFDLKDFGAHAVIPASGETVTVEFVADKPGRFGFACSEFCGAGHPDMKGLLIVHAPGEK